MWYLIHLNACCKCTLLEVWIWVDQKNKSHLGQIEKNIFKWRYQFRFVNKELWEIVRTPCRAVLLLASLGSSFILPVFIIIIVFALGIFLIILIAVFVLLTSPGGQSNVEGKHGKNICPPKIYCST